MKWSCICGHYGDTEVNMDPDSVMFNAVSIRCHKCGLETWWHSGKNLQESSVCAIEDWEKVQRKAYEAKDNVASSWG